MIDLTAARKLAPAELEALDYESARGLLDQVVTSLEDSKLPLAELMVIWELGERIAAVCEAHLKLASEKMQDGLPTE